MATMMKASDSYLVCVDINNDNQIVISVAKHTGRKMDIVNVLSGVEAAELYSKLIK